MNPDRVLDGTRWGLRGAGTSLRRPLAGATAAIIPVLLGGCSTEHPVRDPAPTFRATTPSATPSGAFAAACTVDGQAALSVFTDRLRQAFPGQQPTQGEACSGGGTDLVHIDLDEAVSVASAVDTLKHHGCSVAPETSVTPTHAALTCTIPGGHGLTGIVSVLRVHLPVHTKNLHDHTDLSASVMRA